MGAWWQLLGAEVSRTRSVAMDEWADEEVVGPPPWVCGKNLSHRRGQVESMEVGNVARNQVWEAMLAPSQKKTHEEYTALGLSKPPSSPTNPESSAQAWASPGSSGSSI